MDEKKKQGIWLAIICFVVLFLFMGETSFHTKGEPREAVVALSMLKDGNWILPVNNGVDIAYKPPLFHWMIAVASSVVGEVTEYTARFPSALMLMVMLLAGYAFYARRRGAEVAMVASLVTLTNFEVHRAGVNCRVDMVLAAFMVLALYLLYIWYERRLRGVPWLAILCLSGAALTKGPVGIVLPCGAAFLFCWMKGYRFLPLVGKYACVALAACILPMLWYIAAYQQGGERFLSLVVEENVLRFMGKMTYGSHENPAYYNLVTLVAGFVPYTLFLVVSLFFLKYKKPELQFKGLWARLTQAIRTMDETRLYTLTCAVVIFVFYCIPKSKRSVYLLPMYPFVAYFIAEYLLYLRRQYPRVLKISVYILSVASLLLLALFLFIRVGGVQEAWIGGRHPEETWAYIQALRYVPLGVVPLLLLALSVMTIYYSALHVKEKRELLSPLFALVLSIYLTLDGFYQPTVLNVKSDKPMAREIATLVPQGRIYSYRSENTEGNPLHPFTVNFYLGDRIVPFQAFLPEEGYLLMGEHEREPFLKQYADYALEDIYNSNRRSCDDHSVVHLYRFRQTHKQSITK
ncbi:dolichyl-phosphate-mannose--protein mannosyltransferase [Parabacteroides sp. An277]|uniref:ArnT family glycosyltransferase n=1 Tax=Parabacteroides sp. An277 TaxID=1965619 RepID=UPI000B3957F5|nr:glycosyltransferase family 39 protein [Parabacteroides sp. An277]OUO53319.1 dolichyl-phosphate-mannose--protein mannosyltransferase [Parabacteroides sp. An277]